MWFRRRDIKAMQKELKKIGTHEGPKVLKKRSTMKAYKKMMMIAMSQNKKLERDHSYKRSIV